MSNFSRANKTLEREAANMSKENLLELVDELRVAGHEEPGEACPICRVGELEESAEPGAVPTWSCRCQEILERELQERNRSEQVKATIAAKGGSGRPDGLCELHDFQPTSLTLTETVSDYPPATRALKLEVCRECGLVKVAPEDLDGLVAEPEDRT